MKNFKNIVFFTALLLGMPHLSFAQTNVSGNISTNIIWTSTGSPYIVTSNVTVQAGAALTVDPGVVVKFALNTTLFVSGTLISQGTLANPITYTSNSATPAPGNWDRIQLNASSTGSVFEYSKIEYSSSGLYLENIYPTIQNNSFSNNSSKNLYISSSTTTPVTINASNNWWGTADPTQIYNKLSINGLAPGHTSANQFVLLNVSSFLDAPGGNSLGNLAFGNISQNFTWSGTVFVTANVNIPTGVSLTVSPGTVVKFTPGLFHINAISGTLNAVGSWGNEIVFTSNQIVQSFFDWGGIQLGNTSILDHVIVEYSIYGVQFLGSSGVVQNSLLKKNYYGISIYTIESPQILNNTIRLNTTGIYISVYQTTSATPTIDNNLIYNNSQYNLLTNYFGPNTVTINASNNWWGSAVLATINASIYDQLDHPYHPLVNIAPFNTTADIINITNNTVSQRFFTPVSQPATINYTLDQPSNIVIKIYSTLSGSLVRTLVNFQPRAVGVNSEIWDGLNDFGVAVPLGGYIYTLSAVNITSGALGEYDPLFVSGPVQILNGTLSPANFDPHKGEVATVAYNLSAPGYVTLKVGNIGSFVASRTLLNNIPRDITNNSETWDGRDDSGNLISENISVYGWAYLLPDNSIVAQSNLDVSSIKSDPYVIYPLYGGATQIQYTLSIAANVTVEILSPSGSIERTLISNQSQSAGVQSVIWDGKNSFGKKATMQGNYNVRILLSDATNINSIVKLGNIRVVK